MRHTLDEPIISTDRLPFDDYDLTVNLNPPRQQLRNWNPNVKPPGNVHYGQIKLFAAEMAFFNMFVQDNMDECVIVYAGAASGQHIKPLSELFPNTEFHLYDPAKFAIKEEENIHIYNEIFTDEIALQWKNYTEKDVIFISDVRTSGDTAEEHESEVDANMKMQAKWVQIMKPKWASLKFRISYAVIERKQSYKYFNGTLIYQAYPKALSMEMRLFLNEEDIQNGITYNYNGPLLEKTLFYHNTVIRPDLNRYVNIFTMDDSKYMWTGMNLNNGYDCTYLLHVVKHYVEKYGKYLWSLGKEEWKDYEERTSMEELVSKLIFEILGKISLHRRSLK